MSEHALLFTLGFVLLAVGTVLLGNGVGQLVRRCGIAPWVIGLVVVPVAAASPVLAVTVNTSLQHRDNFTVGMILGSTVVNIGFALGTAALRRPLSGSSKLVTASISMLFAAVLLFWFVGRDNSVTRLDAAILLVAFVAAVAYLVWTARDETEEAKAPFTQWHFTRWPAGFAALMAIAGIVGLTCGAFYVVPEAVELARMQPKGTTHLFGSLAVVLASSLVLFMVTESAARNNHGDLAIGTVVGASLCNLLLLPAVAALIAPFGVANVTLMNDIPATALITFLLLVPFSNGLQVARSEGAILLTASVAYIGWQIWR